MEEQKNTGTTSQEVQKEENKDKKIKNLFSIVIVLGGLFVGSLFVDVAQLVKGGGYSQKALQKTDVFESAGKTWVAYKDPVVKIKVLTDAACAECAPDETLAALRRALPTISASKVEIDSEEGKKMLTDLSIKTLPTFIFSADIEKTEFFTQAQPIFEKKDKEYVLKNAEAGIPVGKYLELPQITDKDIQMGSKDAKVKIIEFSDFQCPYCAKLHPETKKIVAEYGDKVLYSFKQLPLSFHAQAESAALASECANEQGKFAAYADKLFATQADWGKTKGVQSFKTYAAQIGMNAAQFNKCLDDKKYQEIVNSNKKEAEGFGISGTPAVFINGQFKNGAVSYEELKKMVDAELQK